MSRTAHRLTRSWKLLVVGFVLMMVCVGWLIARHPDIVHMALGQYEEFQEIYATCQQINTDLGILREVDEHDQMFSTFSKVAQVANKRQQLSRWVTEYNARSRMRNRALWKSRTLPYELHVDDFANFSERVQRKPSLEVRLSALLTQWMLS